MRDSKLILEAFDPKKQRLIPKKFLSKILGGDDTLHGSRVSPSNSGELSYSPEIGSDVEKSKEK